ncbi:hypothetical protein [Streptomyces sp. 5-10]|uniref:hypothetical protein n=1 Tax=Streptomyces sp. 5-10 TaxID=878925 RepID=UPI00168AF68B|nr:hypothetical protein [Streptomyces sp. 5-10]MBD3004617.1 hypothetical protein [Streptomyces sp. 5-10]
MATAELSITVRGDKAWGAMSPEQLLREEKRHEEFIKGGGLPDDHESLVRADHQLRLIRKALNGKKVAAKTDRPVTDSSN